MSIVGGIELEQIDEDTLKAASGWARCVLVLMRTRFASACAHAWHSSVIWAPVF